MEELRIPRLRVPIELGAGSLRAIEQDSDEDVAQSAYMLLATPRDSRLEEPGYGVEDPTFEELPLELDEWLEQLAVWEPRAAVATGQEIEDLTARVAVEVGAHR